MTRTENIKRIHKNKKENTQRKIANLITGIFADEYKKKDGSYNVSKIAKDTNLSRPTVIKHLKLIKEEGII
jgi:Fic family protein